MRPAKVYAVAAPKAPVARTALSVQSSSQAKAVRSRPQFLGAQRLQERWQSRPIGTSTLRTRHDLHIQIVGRGRSAVLVSEEEWRAIQESLNLLSIQGMRESIHEGLE